MRNPSRDYDCLLSRNLGVRPKSIVSEDRHGTSSAFEMARVASERQYPQDAGDTFRGRRSLIVSRRRPQHADVTRSSA